MNKRIKKKQAKATAYRLLKDFKEGDSLLYVPGGVLKVKFCSHTIPVSASRYPKIEFDGYITESWKGPLF